MPDITVRPKGYVEDDPVIRPIGERNLYLGNKHAADPDQHDQSFRYVVSLSTDEYPLTTHHHPLDDGPGNDWTTFERAVDTARTLYQRDGSVMIHCTAGISRSSTIIATMLAAEESRQLHDTLSIIQQVRPSATPHPALHEQSCIWQPDRESHLLTRFSVLTTVGQNVSLPKDFNRAA
ncbi:MULTISPECIES: dual specificity protein phosphatase family protein [Halorubrum]|uniref:protein-tyrosine phosphatase family protein n=1 Tax=Halorubrum TaxID=56688 RepID=UPI0010F946F3|nr:MULTISPECIES: dual specificity protein phosphatase [Halorubrum]TKX66138.1 phosphatase [Halorubrum sp. GN11GM_10-3_MGM]